MTMSEQVSDIWQAYEKLVGACPLVIDRPAGSVHPRLPGRIYPLDYGYLDGTQAMDGGGIDVWRGQTAGRGLIALAITVDLVKRDTEIKLILDCSDEEIAVIDRFHNDSDVFRAQVFRRESRVSSKSATVTSPS